MINKSDFIKEIKLIPDIIYYFPDQESILPNPDTFTHIRIEISQAEDHSFWVDRSFFKYYHIENNEQHRRNAIIFNLLYKYGGYYLAPGLAFNKQIIDYLGYCKLCLDTLNLEQLVTSTELRFIGSQPHGQDLILLAKLYTEIISAKNKKPKLVSVPKNKSLTNITGIQQTQNQTKLLSQFDRITKILYPPEFFVTLAG